MGPLTSDLRGNVSNAFAGTQSCCFNVHAFLLVIMLKDLKRMTNQTERLVGDSCVYFIGVFVSRLGNPTHLRGSRGGNRVQLRKHVDRAKISFAPNKKMIPQRRDRNKRLIWCTSVVHGLRDRNAELVKNYVCLFSLWYWRGSNGSASGTSGEPVRGERARR